MIAEVPNLVFGSAGRIANELAQANLDWILAEQQSGQKRLSEIQHLVRWRAWGWPKVAGEVEKRRGVLLSHQSTSKGSFII
jgi:hypothetical protein